MNRYTSLVVAIFSVLAFAEYTLALSPDAESNAKDDELAREYCDNFAEAILRVDWKRVIPNSSPQCREFQSSRRKVISLGADSIPHLCRLSRHENARVRRWAVDAIPFVDASAESAVGALIIALRDPDETVRFEAAEAFGRIGPCAAKAVAALIEAMQDSAVCVRIYSAKALGKIGATTPRVVPTLIMALSDEHHEVRWRAAESLGGMGLTATTAIPVLEQLLDDRDGDVRNAAQEAVTKLRDAETRSGLDERHLKQRYDAFVETLDRKRIATDYPKAVQKLDSPDPRVRIVGIKTLAATEEVEVIPWIVPFVDSKERHVRICAGQALNALVAAHELKRRDKSRPEKVVILPPGPGETDLKPMAWVILKMLRMPDDGNTHAFGANMIGYLRLGQFEGELRELLKSRHPAVTRAARNALEMICVDGLPDADRVVLKIVESTIEAPGVKQQCQGTFVVKNIGPAFRIPPNVVGPDYGVFIYCEQGKLLFRNYGGWGPGMKAGGTIRLSWNTSSNHLGETSEPPFLVPAPGRYRLEIVLSMGLKRDRILDVSSKWFEVTEVAANVKTKPGVVLHQAEKVKVPSPEPTKPKPDQLNLTLGWIADSDKRGEREYLFVLNGIVAYRTLDGLRNHVKGLPKGSTIRWAPGCCRMGDEPLLSSPEELQRFKTFCESCGVALEIIPSG